MMAGPAAGAFLSPLVGNGEGGGAVSTLSAAVLASDKLMPPERCLAVVADRQLSVAAMAALLVRNDRYRLLEEVRGTDEVRRLVRSFKPQVLVVETASGESLGAVDPSSWAGRILFLLDPEDDALAVLAAVRTVVHGYLPRSASPETFDMAIESLRTSGYYLHPLLVGPVLSALRELPAAPASGSKLTDRERKVLVRIATGRSSKEIAREFSISQKTVSNHVKNVYRKLGLRDRGQLVLYAAQQGLTGF
jgi:DNA-binding NarL/FixJ family response regulator